MSNYQWIHPPLKLVKEQDDTYPLHLQITQDHINEAEVALYSFDVPEESRHLYADDLVSDEARAADKEAHDDDQDVEPVEYVSGFFLSGSSDGYSDEPRDPLKDPQPNDVFVYISGPERESPGCYLPIGQHCSGSYHVGDYLISIEDYEAISAGIYTPNAYTCDVVREWEPHKQLRSAV